MQWVWKLGLLEEQEAPLTTKPSLQNKLYFKNYIPSSFTDRCLSVDLCGIWRSGNGLLSIWLSRLLTKKKATQKPEFKVSYPLSPLVGHLSLLSIRRNKIKQPWASDNIRNCISDSLHCCDKIPNHNRNLRKEGRKGGKVW